MTIRTPIPSRPLHCMVSGLLSLQIIAGMLSPVAHAQDAGSTSEPRKPGPGEILQRGSVVDEDSQPVAGAQVTIHIWRSPVVVRTDTEGRFSAIIPSAIRRALYFTAADGKRHGMTRLPFEVQKNQNLAPRIRLRPPKRLELRVVDAEGRPVANAMAAFAIPWAWVRKGRTDENGILTADVPASLTPNTAFAYKSKLGLGYFTRTFDVRRPNVREAKPPIAFPNPVTVKLDGARTVRFKLQDLDGNPVAGVTVRPWYFDNPDLTDHLNLFFEDWRKKTDGNGIVEYDWIPTWQKQVLSFAHESPEHDYVYGRFDPKNAIDGTTIDWKVGRLVPLSGRVRFPDGSPAPGMLIRFYGLNADHRPFRRDIRTDAEGRFRQPAAPHRLYMAAIIDAKWAAPARDGFITKPGQPIDGLDFDLKPAQRIFGRLTVGEDKRPVTGAQIQLWHKGENAHGRLNGQLPNPNKSNYYIEPRIIHYVKTDQEGWFEFHVGPGKYHIRPPSQVKSQNFTLNPEDAEREFEFHMARPERGRVSGLVVQGPAKHPVADVAIVGVHHHQLADDVKAVSSRLGRFEFERKLHPMVLYARSKDDTLGAIVEIGAEDKEVTIPLIPTATYRGRLIDQDGKPIKGLKLNPGIIVHLGDKDAPFQNRFAPSVTTDDDGRFEIPRLVPGNKYFIDTWINGVGYTIRQVTPKKGVDTDPGDVKFNLPKKKQAD